VATRILLIGAYGQFGRRIASALADDARLTLILAGRDLATAEQLRTALTKAGARATLLCASVDVESADLAQAILALAPQQLIHTAGPFQRRDYRVAEAALACGAHYLDLADGRDFVLGIEALDAAAKAAGCWVISGASSVPGLSAAVIEAHRPRFASLQRVEAAICPGNRTSRGLATTRAILGYVGRPFPALIDGRWQRVHGWQSLRRLHLPPLGPRWVARCEVPDLGVLPQRYSQLQHCDFRAGLELRRMHFGLWLASLAVRLGLPLALPRWAPALLRLSERWLQAGSDSGMMCVEMAGLDPQGAPLRLRWHLLAHDGCGPQVPATAAVVLARKLAGGELPGGGARPCLDLFTLAEFLDALAGYPISTGLQQLP
jgi:saccharopine dehydrogenase-like NADP-dependent oxidoreductase